MGWGKCLVALTPAHVVPPSKTFDCLLVDWYNLLFYLGALAQYLGIILFVACFPAVDVATATRFGECRRQHVFIRAPDGKTFCNGETFLHGPLDGNYEQEVEGPTAKRF